MMSHWTASPKNRDGSPKSAPAQGSLPPLVDRAELIALLEDLASLNMTRDACERQAMRMADDLIARGLFTAPQTASREADHVKRVSKRIRATGDKEAADLIETLFLAGLAPPQAPSRDDIKCALSRPEQGE